VHVIEHGCAARDSYIIHDNVPLFYMHMNGAHTIYILFRELLYILGSLIFLGTILYDQLV